MDVCIEILAGITGILVGSQFLIYYKLGRLEKTIRNGHCNIKGHKEDKTEEEV